MSCFLFLILSTVLLVSCSPGVSSLETSKIPTSNAIIGADELRSFNATIKKSVYIPVYSNILNYDKNVQISLQALLSVRNTDQNRNLKISKITYFDTNGKKIRDILKDSFYLKPLGSYEVVIKTSDLEGGSGAKFIVDWESDNLKIQNPLMEVIVTGFMNSTNISFSSRGVTLD